MRFLADDDKIQHIGFDLGASMNEWPVFLAGRFLENCGSCWRI